MQVDGVQIPSRKRARTDQNLSTSSKKQKEESKGNEGEEKKETKQQQFDARVNYLSNANSALAMLTNSADGTFVSCAASILRSHFAGAKEVVNKVLLLLCQHLESAAAITLNTVLGGGRTTPARLGRTSAAAQKK
jgi:hypothetical protein